MDRGSADVRVIPPVNSAMSCLLAGRVKCERRTHTPTRYTYLGMRLPLTRGAGSLHSSAPATDDHVTGSIISSQPRISARMWWESESVHFMNAKRDHDKTRQ